VTEVSSEENDWRASVESYSDSQAILEKGWSICFPCGFAPYLAYRLTDPSL
jgi:hypothetical protein